jgi:hypothetical protein
VVCALAAAGAAYLFLWNANASSGAVRAQAS